MGGHFTPRLVGAKSFLAGQERPAAERSFRPAIPGPAEKPDGGLIGVAREDDNNQNVFL